MKKQYMTPSVEVMEIMMATQLLAGSTLSVDGDTDTGFAGAPGMDFPFDSEE